MVPRRHTPIIRSHLAPTICNPQVQWLQRCPNLELSGDLEFGLSTHSEPSVPGSGVMAPPHRWALACDFFDLSRTSSVYPLEASSGVVCGAHPSFWGIFTISCCSCRHTALRGCSCRTRSRDPGSLRTRVVELTIFICSAPPADFSETLRNPNPHPTSRYTWPDTRLSRLVLWLLPS